MKKISSTILISVLVVFVSGIGAGFLIKTIQVSPKLAVIKSLSSKAVPSMVAYGQVSQVEGRDITLTYDNNSVKVTMAENSPVYAFVNNSTGGKATQNKVSINEIKIGDNLSITAKLLANGILQGQSAFILLPSSGTKTQ